MDDFEMEGELLRETLDQLDSINKWLGGNRVTLNGLKLLLKSVEPERTLRIVDLGCGSGDMLRRLATYFRKEGRKVEFIGIDGNEFTINYARSQSTDYPEISYRHQMIPSKEFSDLNCDIILSTLFLHHFRETEALELLRIISEKAQIGLVINDLHRNQWAYILFKLLGLFISNRMVREDGLTSILRGFKKSELQHIAKVLNFKNSNIQWRWAFRYQWTILR